MTETLRLQALTVSNILRLDEVHIEFDDCGIVVIGGRNGQGKTSIINALCMAIGGRIASFERPIKDGADKGVITVDLGKYIVTRTYFRSGKTTLVVTNSEGAKYSSPGDLLRKFIGDLTFDPMAFARMTSKEQVAALQELTGLDFSELDKERAAAFASRTNVNRDAKKLAAQLESMRLHEDAPSKKVSVAGLMEELDAIAKAVTARGAVADREAELERASEATHETHQKGLRAIRELDEHRAALVAMSEQNAALAKTALDASEKFSLEFAELRASNPIPDTDTIKLKIAGADEQNQKLAQNGAHGKLVGELAELHDESAKLGERITAIDADKRARLTASKLPVEGMSFGEDGVTVEGVPYSQCSDGQRREYGFELALAQDPALKLVCIRDASLLDEDALRHVKDLADAHKTQLILEVVGNPDDVTVTIEDGAVVEAEATGAAA